jgi:hypothetical protein
MEGRPERDQNILYAPAICPQCGKVFHSDVPVAAPPWITPVYRATGGCCPRCGARSAIAPWTYRFHSVAVQSLTDSSDHQRRDLAAALEHHLRRHRTAKRTTAFIRDLRGPWKNLCPLLLAAAPTQRRAQLTLLLWTLTTADR